MFHADSITNLKKEVNELKIQLTKLSQNKQ